MERRFVALLRLFPLGDVVQGRGTADVEADYTQALCFGADRCGCNSERDRCGAQECFHGAQECFHGADRPLRLTF